jgi:hypothetical protein
MKKAHRTAAAMPAARKRARETAKIDVAVPPSAVDFRAALVSRCGDSSPPGAWRAAAATAGVSGADAFLCHLGRSIVAALQSIPAKAESARARLRSTRAALLSAVNSRCDELEARINCVESDKIASLERELCAVDATLERLRAERGAVAETTSSLGDAELEARKTELIARLDDADMQLLALPTTVVEPPYVGLVVGEAARLADVLALGRVVAPKAVTAADLAFDSAAPLAHPGGILKLRVALQGAQHAMQSAEELGLSLAAAASATHVEATLKAEGAAPQPLKIDVSADVPKRCLFLSIAVPLGTSIGSSVCFGPLTVSGQPVSGLLGPLVVKVRGVRHSNT